MDGRLFTVVSAEDDRNIFAWGMEIADEDRTEAITYRRNPITGKCLFGVYSSAENALRRYNKMAPMAIVWEDEELYDLLDELESRTVGQTPRDRAVECVPDNGNSHDIMAELVEGLENFADSLDATADETAAAQDRDNGGAAGLLSAMAMLSASARALARGDVVASASHTKVAMEILDDSGDVELRPTNPAPPTRQEDPN